MSTGKREQKHRNRDHAAGRQARAAVDDPMGQRQPPSRHIVALSLAHEMADAVGAVGDDCQELVFAALAAGEWLAMVGRPGRWDTLDVAKILQVLPSDDQVAQGGFLIALAGLLGYAALAGHLSPAHAVRGLDQIEALADDAIVKNYARQSAVQLRGGRGGRTVQGSA